MSIKQLSAQYPSKRQMFAFGKDFKMQHVFVGVDYRMQIDRHVSRATRC